MLNTAGLIAFAATAKPKAARAFYEKTLGLKLVEDSPFALVFDVSGTMLRVQKVESVNATGYTALGWRVADIGKAVRKLADRGVVFERYPGMDQDKAGVWTSPAGALIAWFNDPDGNILSLTQF
jgi:catechol 2,3-dioxygenase-like lactoylglutathione lyase family enzyme